MNGTGEINALLNLIDDPDEEVYTTVHEKILSYGSPIIPNLENLWENTISEDVQQRIESIIHNIHFRDLKEEFMKWKNSEQHLLAGALLVAKYQYPDMEPLPTLQEVEKIRRNVWIEMNSYLTPLEQTKVLDSILYNYYKIKGGEIAYHLPNEFMIHKTLETKKGNAITAGILYQVLCQMLDIPVNVVAIPQQFLMGYFMPKLSLKNPVENAAAKIKFFIDPSTGNAHSHLDIENYLKKIGIASTPSYFKPLDNKRIIQVLLEEFSKCFSDPKKEYKRLEILELMQLLDD